MGQAWLVVLTLLAAAWTTSARAQVPFCDIYPPEVLKCFKEAHKHPVEPQLAHAACVRKHYIDTEADMNLTMADMQFFHERSVHKFGAVPPPTGFRIRKEYRRLTKRERMRLHNALNVLYRKGIIQRFGRLHATASRSIHRGAAFLPWHRVFIADFEEELRRVDPTVSLAYWDMTMDVNMTRPSDSVVFSPCFFGNGNGTITEGPFRGWYGGRNGPIQRDYARDECDNGRLISKMDILRILSKCRLEEISAPPPRDNDCSLEFLHNGPHTWLGGDFGDLFLSAFDPVFYFHHAFVDYIWELFRRNQARRCHIDPETDYPIDLIAGDKGEGHSAYDTMAGYEHLRNIDGLSHIFIKYFYKYETLPSCPDCGSKYLVCDVKRQICISRGKETCNMRMSGRGEHTYTRPGMRLSSVGFTGPIANEMVAYPIKAPFKSLPGDGRYRNMPLADARAILEGGNMGTHVPMGAPFSPLVPLMPMISGSFGVKPLHSSWLPPELSQIFSPQWADFQKHAWSKGLSGMDTRIPHNPGFIPFKTPHSPHPPPLPPPYSPPPNFGSGSHFGGHGPTFPSAHGIPSFGNLNNYHGAPFSHIPSFPSPSRTGYYL